MPYNENIYISKAMVKQQRYPQRYLFFPTTYSHSDDVVKFEKDKIVELLLKTGAQSSSKTLSQGSTATVKTYLQIYPKLIKVEINNGLAKIGLYE